MDDAGTRGAVVPRISIPMHPECRAVAIVPARDEAETLGATLRAFAGQVDGIGRPLPRSSFEVIVLANNCRDDSAAIARRFAASAPGLTLQVAEAEFPPEVAHVGTSRKWLMDEACRRLLGSGKPRGVIASTDGDSRVGPTWLFETWRAVDRGADAVGGDIRTDRAGRLALCARTRRSYLRDVLYRRLVDELASRLDPDPRDPWPRHHHHTGASLAITARAYREVGGLPPLRSSEDLALVAAVRRAGLALRHAPRVRVVTSTRRLGRAAGGMADTLLGWTDGPDDLRVEDPRATEARLAAARGLPAGLLPPADGGDPIPIDRAIADLRRRLATLRPIGRSSPAVPEFLEQVDAVGGFPSPVPMF